MTDLTKYIDYINNTSYGTDDRPLPIALFDEDHDPVGPMIRSRLVKADMIQERAGGIVLRPDLIRRRT
jgi:hypothetical protein